MLTELLLIPLGEFIIISVGFFFLTASYIIFSFLHLWTSQDSIGSGENLLYPGFYEEGMTHGEKLARPTHRYFWKVSGKVPGTSA